MHLQFFFCSIIIHNNTNFGIFPGQFSTDDGENGIAGRHTAANGQFACGQIVRCPQLVRQHRFKLAGFLQEIDIHRAKEAKVRAERRLKGAEGEINEHRAEIALRKALIRLELGERSGR